MALQTVPTDLYVDGDLRSRTLTAPASSITTANLQNAAVTAGKLTTTLSTGFVPLSLHEAREMFTNDYGAAADGAATGGGGILASDTTPILQRVNAATDKQTRIVWAAGNVDEIQWQMISPPDLDPAAPVYVNVRAKMAASADTPTITVAFFEDVGGSNLGGATGALSSSVASVSKAVTVTATAAAQKAWAISIKPGTHATDAVHAYACWVTYTRL